MLRVVIPSRLSTPVLVEGCLLGPTGSLAITVRTQICSTKNITPALLNTTQNFIHAAS